MHVDVIDSPEALAALKSNWDAVYDADPEAQFFLSWTWIANWLQEINFQWLVLAAKASPDASAYGAFFPLVLRTERGKECGFYNEIRTGGGWFAPYDGLICIPDIEDQAIPAFSNHILGLNWASLKLENIFATSKRLSLLLKPFAQPGLVTAKLERPDDGDGIDRDIYLYVKLPGQWDAFLERNLSSNSRKKAKRIMRMLEGSAELRITHADANSFERDLDTLLGFWQAQWGAKTASQYGERVAVGTLSHYRNMLTSCFGAGSLYLPVLWQGETPIGAMGTLIDAKKRSLISLIGGRDLTATSLQPGFILDLHSIRWAIQNGFSTYDLLMGNFPYKYSLGPEERRIEPLCVRTKSGRNLRDKLEPRSLPAVLERVKALSERGERAGAMAGLWQVLDVDPRHAGALKLLELLEAGRPLTPRAEMNKGLELHRRGKFAEAEQIYRSILASDPEHFDATHLLGVIFLQRNQFELAERQIGLALAIAPDMAAAHNNRGNALRGLKRFDEALASFDRAIALNPHYAEAFNNRGNVMRDLERFDEALKSYDKAIALRRDYAGALKNRANVVRELERRSSARAGHDGASAVEQLRSGAKPERVEAPASEERLGNALAERETDGALRVRDYGGADRAACLAIFDTNVPKYFAAHERRDFISFLDKLPGPYLVIEDAGTVVACGGFARYESEPHVVALCWGMVAQGRHKKGLGQALLIERLRRAVKTYSEQDIVVYTSQHTAGFFARYGFETCRVVRDHFAPGLDLHKMRIRTDEARRLF